MTPGTQSPFQLGTTRSGHRGHYVSPIKRRNLCPVGKVVGSEGLRVAKTVGTGHITLLGAALCGQTQLLARAASRQAGAPEEVVWVFKDSGHPVFTGTGTTRHSDTGLGKLTV